jgi:hypothetical protein
MKATPMSPILSTFMPKRNPCPVWVHGTWNDRSIYSWGMQSIKTLAGWAFEMQLSTNICTLWTEIQLDPRNRNRPQARLKCTTLWLPFHWLSVLTPESVTWVGTVENSKERQAKIYEQKKHVDYIQTASEDIYLGHWLVYTKIHTQKCTTLSS